MMEERIVHFEIPADDPERAKDFYEKVFGWKIEKWDGPMDYWLVNTGEKDPGINGGLTRRADPVTITTNTVGVENLDNKLNEVTGAGGEIVMPRSVIPNMGYLAYCKDTEGNIFGLMESDESAEAEEVE
ncbi:MAG: VOC family protein [Patescibacteria group bacterium]|jgi:hypothetical protein|nr:VOC family protein [Patescibacteria group bacterium]